ncbi:MAG: nucleotidyltransferase domain-containing protein [Planctomycetes bacterium]|nr:nucleotidyltransferase domain-containing protein [Planctomycetota bacterium]
MIERELPTFIIPPGTQVVLKAARRVSGTDREKPAGSVAVVVQSPSTNARSYRIRFTDGVELRAKLGELAVRRREVEDELEAARDAVREALTTPGEDLRRWLVYRCETGSRAFGLAGDDSDTDIRGVYLPPACRTWSLWKPPEQWEARSEDRDETYWELEHFLVLALKANPSILETLWTPRVLEADETGRELLALREAFLSRHVYKTYSGYVLAQFRRMRNSFEKTGKFKAKHAMHLVRLLLSGIHAVRTGEILVDVSEHRDLLLPIRRGERTFDEVQSLALDLERRFQEAFASTSLPERPDYARVDAFLIGARRRRVDA